MKSLFLAPLVVFAIMLQAGPLDVPTLTTEQKLQIQNAAQRIQIAQLQAQAAQRDFDAARNDLQGLLKTLEKEGYTLNLQSLAYVKKDAPKK